MQTWLRQLPPRRWDVANPSDFPLGDRAQAWVKKPPKSAHAPRDAAGILAAKLLLVVRRHVLGAGIKWAPSARLGFVIGESIYIAAHLYYQTLWVTRSSACDENNYTHVYFPLHDRELFFVLHN